MNIGTIQLNEFADDIRIKMFYVDLQRINENFTLEESGYLPVTPVQV